MWAVVRPLLCVPSVDGDNSRLTRLSSSSSESRMTISALRGPTDFAPFSCFNVAFAGEREFFLVCDDCEDGAGCAAFHEADAYLLSVVCHCPSGSTMTSSTSSVVHFRISSKYLYAFRPGGHTKEQKHLPVDDEILWIENLFTNGTHPRCGLFHDREPRKSVKTLRMHTCL